LETDTALDLCGEVKAIVEVPLGHYSLEKCTITKISANKPKMTGKAFKVK
jgi:hypothetical protein